MKYAAAFTIWLWRNFGGTVEIAEVTKTLRVELQRRAEYAIKFGIHPPRRWRC
jgi:hypothetical protein